MIWGHTVGCWEIRMTKKWSECIGLLGRFQNGTNTLSGTEIIFRKPTPYYPKNLSDSEL